MKQATQPQEAETKNSTKLPQIAYSDTPTIFDVGSLCEFLEQVTDGRRARGKRYGLMTLLVFILLAKLCGQDTPEAIADWVKYRAEGLVGMLGLKRTAVPHATTYARVMKSSILPEQFESVMHAFFARQTQVQEGRQICIDGKVIRGTQQNEQDSNVYLLGAYVPGAGVMLLQTELQPGEGELSVAPRLLKALDLKGKWVTGDAAFTQRNLSVQIVHSGGAYVWKVKTNQPKLHSDIERLFEPQPPALPGFSLPKTDFKSVTHTVCGHGRIDTYTLTASSLLNATSDWPSLEQVFKINRQSCHKKSGETTQTITYGVTSLNVAEASPKQLLKIVRGHWAIEGGSHQCRDVTFHEDHCDLRRGHAAHIMAIVNNIALSLIGLARLKNVAAARRRFTATPENALALLIHPPS